MFKRPLADCLIAGLVCTLSACSATSTQRLEDDPRYPSSAATEQAAPASTIQQTSHAEPRKPIEEWSALPPGQTDIIVNPKYTQPKQQTTFRGQSPESVAPGQSSHSQPISNPYSARQQPSYTIERTIAEPRVNLSTNQPVQQTGLGHFRKSMTPQCQHDHAASCPACQPQTAYPVPFAGCPIPQPGMPYIAEHYPDEYLCDGGDRDTPVHYNLRMRKGLDTEDTIAEFTGSNGSYNVKQTNKVCIYAPKFAAVMHVSDPIENTHVNRAGGYHEMSRGYAVVGKLALDEQQRTEQLNTAAIRSRASGLNGETETGMVGQATRHQLAFQNIAVLEKLAAVSLGDFTSTDITTIASALQVAGNWTRQQNPMITARAQGGNEVIATFKAQEIVGIEDRGTPGELQIVKLADQKAALPGDVITFTIRFDNTGDKSIYEIRIVDNLTPRLQLIEGSAECSLPADFIVEDNFEGSHVLTWQLKEPLAGHTGGVITFKTRLR